MDYSKLYQFLMTQTGQLLNDESPNYRIEKDLGIYGDEAEDLLIKFSNEFNVNIDDFNFGEYFNCEMDRISLFILNFFRKIKKKDLTIQDLKKAIVKGKLE